MPDAARLVSCERCGYPLAGLPGTGACPECGTTYVPTDTIVLVGRTRGRRVWMPREGPIPVIAIIVFGLLLITVLSKVFGSGRGELPLFMVLYGIVGAAALARQALILGGTRSRVWLNGSGCRQSDADDCRRLFDVGGAVAFGVAGGAGLVWMTFNRLPQELRWPTLGAGTFLAIVIAALLYVSWRINRSKGTLCSWISERFSSAPQVRWDEVDSGRMVELPGGRRRLLIRAKRDIAGPFVRDAVNLEFEATAEQADALRLQIERWRKGLLSADASG